MTTARNERFPLAQKLLVLTRTGSSRLLAARASMMLFNSEAMRADFETHVGRPRRSRVIHPPFERAIVERVDAPPRDLAFVGRLIGMKGADDAVRVSAKIGVPLDVYGDGPERDRCEGLARELDAEVHFHGWVDRREVNTALARAGCLLVPSRSFEAFGQVGPQALSAGCPAVAYDVGGVRAWCLEGMSSVVAAGDVDAMARAADEWLARRRAGLDVSAWSSTIDERFGHARFAREYTAVLEELAA